LRDDSSVGNSALRVFLASSKRTKSRKLIRYEYMFHIREIISS
jgi:hypothetical protein